MGCGAIPTDRHPHQTRSRQQDGDYNDLSTQVSAEVDFTPVPEPMTPTVLASGLIGLAAVRRRRKAA